MNLNVTPLPIRVPLRRSQKWQRDDRYGAVSAGMMAVLIVLMIVPDGFNYQSLTTTGSPDSASLISRGLWVGLLLLGVGTILVRFDLARLQFRQLNVFMILYVMLATGSVLWSIDPTLSVRRLIRLITIISVCGSFVLVAWSPQRFQNVVRPTLTLMLAGSLIFGIVRPDLAIHQEVASELAGAWRGLTSHKNGFGALSCTTLILWVHAWFSGEARLRYALPGVAIASVCLLLSRSSTSLAAALAIILFLTASLRTGLYLQTRLPRLAAVVTGLLLLYALATLDLLPGLGLLLKPIAVFSSKDTSLTGRTEIWAIIEQHVRLRPLLGSGFAAYWTPEPIPGADSYEFVRRMGSFYPGSSHNGYLEVLNDLGWVGLSCLVGYIATHVRHALVLIQRDRSSATLVLAIFFQQAITNLSETHWFDVKSVDFVMMTLASMVLARGLLQPHLQARFGNPFVAQEKSLPPGKPAGIPSMPRAARP